jgi:hypothetical protein
MTDFNEDTGFTTLDECVFHVVCKALQVANDNSSAFNDLSDFELKCLEDGVRDITSTIIQVRRRRGELRKYPREVIADAMAEAA